MEHTVKDFKATNDRGVTGGVPGGYHKHPPAAELSVPSYRWNQIKTKAIPASAMTIPITEFRVGIWPNKSAPRMTLPVIS
jgi:hypothetical protein